MKIYDARDEGGFPYLFPTEPCKASDECHGASSASPPPIEVGSEAGTPGNYERAKPCRKGYVRRHGKCVKPRHRKHHRTTTSRGGHK